jgi:electron transfer flavoprotein beta subunit
MRVLVSIKRVPNPGAKIPITPDGLAVDAAQLGFTISPHEECAVEEAVRLVERHGGDATVITLGPPEAEEQLRYAVSLGADHAVLLPTDGADWDPQRTAAALAAAAPARGA